LNFVKKPEPDVLVDSTIDFIMKIKNLNKSTLDISVKLTIQGSNRAEKIWKFDKLGSEEERELTYKCKVQNTGNYYVGIIVKVDDNVIYKTDFSGIAVPNLSKNSHLKTGVSVALIQLEEALISWLTATELNLQPKHIQQNIQQNRKENVRVAMKQLFDMYMQHSIKELKPFFEKLDNIDGASDLNLEVANIKKIIALVKDTQKEIESIPENVEKTTEGSFF
jgi:hypothetical protein